MKKAFFLFISFQIYTMARSQYSNSALIFFENNVNKAVNFITIIKIDETSNSILYRKLNYLFPHEELVRYKLYGFDSLTCLKKLIDTLKYDTFKYSKNKIVLRNSQFVYYKRGKIFKIRKISHTSEFNLTYEEEFYCRSTSICKYFNWISFDLYDFYKVRFRQIYPTKERKYRVIKNLSNIENFGLKYQYVNYLMPFFSYESFVESREKDYKLCYEIGHFLESYRYIEKIFKGNI